MKGRSFQLLFRRVHNLHWFIWTCTKRAIVIAIVISLLVTWQKYPCNCIYDFNNIWNCSYTHENDLFLPNNTVLTPFKNKFDFIWNTIKKLYNGIWLNAPFCRIRIQVKLLPYTKIFSSKFNKTRLLSECQHPSMKLSK